jgi:multiple sugar transport system permease protein
MQLVDRARPARRKTGSLARQEELWGYLCAFPWFVGFVVFTAGPMLASIGISFTDWTLLTPPKLIGVTNYVQMFAGDPLVWHSLIITSVYAAGSVPLGIAAGMGLALLLNQKIRGLSFIRTVYYLPSVVSGVAVALLWRWIFSADFGLINSLLALVGIQGPAWLSDPSTVLISFIIMSLWSIGGNMVIYLAGLQGIPTDLYEATQVDGANAWTRFWVITVPMMGPVIFFTLITGIIAALQLFTQAYVMTQGGPDNASLFFILYLYRNAFQFFKMGYASALAWLLFVYIMALTVLIIKVLGARVYYEGIRR